MTSSARLIAYGLAVTAFLLTAVVVVGGSDLRTIIGPAAATVFFVVGVGWLVARRSATGMVRLRDAARALAAGDLDARPPLTGSPDQMDVGAAIHGLADQLRGRTGELEQADALLAGLVESLNEAVVVLDSRERVVRINSAARSLFSVTDPVPFPAERLPRTRALHHAMKTALGGQPASAEVEIHGRQASLTGMPLSTGGAVLAALDLTPLRRMEIVRRDFVANVSHELRTPLTVVRGFAETLAADDVAPDARREFSEMIRTNTARMQRIVDDLLDLSRIESGGWVPDPTRVDILAAVREVFAQAESGAREKGLSLTVDVAPGAESVHADRLAVVQTLSNLVENAIRHTVAGGVTVFTEMEEGGTWIGVRDTGQGIQREHLPRIFERFYRADPGRARQTGGTGLGLAIVKHLVEAHGGTVRAESDIGQGTTVRAFFPNADP